MAGFRVKYTLAAKLVNELVEAADDMALTKTIARYGRVDLLCIDELGYMALDKRGAELLFQVLTEREEKASVAIASNEAFSKAHMFTRTCAQGDRNDALFTCEDRVVAQRSYVLLWSRPGMEEALVAYEDSVLAWVSEHDGTILQRARSDGAEGRPLEIQLFEGPSQSALDSFMADPRRTALAGDRDRAIARTEIVPVQFI